MKELTIEQKAAAYERAIEAAKKYHNGTLKDVMETIFPELKESDERIREEIISYIKSSGAVTNQEWIAWLEKQGKNKSIDDLTAQEAMDIAVAKCFEQGEQKPADKVEPKFKVGDWVVLSTSDGETVVQIDSIEYFKSGEPRYITSEGRWFGNGTKARLWAIEDAKPGDVLSDGTTIFIFKDLLSKGSVMSYCDYDTDSGENDAFCPLSVNLMCSKITPATKEQRNLLFQKIKEAGYEWYDTKLELKEIEQEPAETADNSHTWKPSKEQMEALLSEVTAWTKGCPKQKVLESLYNDLRNSYGI